MEKSPQELNTPTLREKLNEFKVFSTLKYVTDILYHSTIQV